MKKDINYRERQCSDFDSRPIPEPEDNLYADAYEDCFFGNTHKNRFVKKSEIIKKSEKYTENT